MRKAMKKAITMRVTELSALDVIEYGVSEKKKVIAYMQSFEPYAVAGQIVDCVTGERLKEADIGYTDGEFRWTSQDVYHIKKYNAAISNEFYKKIVS